MWTKHHLENLSNEILNGSPVCLVILQLNAAAAKGRQQVNIQLAKELQQFNICWTQEEVKNFNNFNFHSLNGRGRSQAC